KRSEYEWLSERVDRLFPSSSSLTMDLNETYDFNGSDIEWNETSEGMSLIEWRHPVLWPLLCSICMITVAGNCLVVAAVCTKKYLRNPTGYLIISLAIADLIVGIAVMPLNSLFEMTHHVWLLGLTSCDIWHALDILASTSSIWNLCIISIDRYLGVRDPIGYRERVSKKRILIAIACVWIMSIALSFPAIIWWRYSSPHLYNDQYKCVFTDSGHYILFSSIVSFYIPLCLILYTYGNVFLIASRHHRSLKTGIKKVPTGTKKKDSESAQSDSGHATLRIHFGRPNAVKEKGAANGGQNTTRLLLKQVHMVSSRSLADRSVALPTSSTPLLAHPSSSRSMNTFAMARPGSRRNPVTRTQSHLLDGRRRNDDNDGRNRTTTYRDGATATTTLNGTHQQPPKKKMNVREKSRRMLKYVHEQRAARTLSIVVGAFIACWLPFFVWSPIAVIFPMLAGTSDQVFTIVTWAGHLNSMLNPLIYSRFSRDFRRAFKQLLTCQRERKVKKAIKTPLSLVFTQLVSITQFWEQQNTAATEVEHLE
ncbi:dop-4, partial [Pristionchus pacificus]